MWTIKVIKLIQIFQFLLKWLIYNSSQNILNWMQQVLIWNWTTLTGNSASAWNSSVTILQLWPWQRNQRRYCATHDQTWFRHIPQSEGHWHGLWSSWESLTKLKHGLVPSQPVLDTYKLNHLIWRRTAERSKAQGEHTHDKCSILRNWLLHLRVITSELYMYLISMSVVLPLCNSTFCL